MDSGTGTPIIGKTGNNNQTTKERSRKNRGREISELKLKYDPFLDVCRRSLPSLGNNRYIIQAAPCFRWPVWLISLVSPLNQILSFGGTHKER
jgi:hypothetical protein